MGDSRGASEGCTENTATLSATGALGPRAKREIPMLRSALTAIAIVIAAIVAFPLYLVVVIGTRRSVHHYYGP